MELNRRLRELDLEHTFVALLYGLYDGSTGSLSLSNAGIPAPVVVSQGGFRTLDLPGIPLGSLDNPEYGQVTMELVPGEILIVASDGLEEAGEATDRPFGANGLASTALGNADESAPKLAQRLIEAAHRHSADDDRADDRTILVLRSVNRR